MATREDVNRESQRETGTMALIPQATERSPQVELMFHPTEHPSRDARLPLSYGRPTPGTEAPLYSQHDRTAQTFWTGQSPATFTDDGGPPIRVPRVHRTAITAWASECSYGVPTTMNGQESGILIKRPIPQFPTRGIRGISGVYTTMDKSASRSFIPSVFVPTSVITGRR